MSSARSSDRVDDRDDRPLVSSGNGAVYGPDGEHSTHHHHTGAGAPYPTQDKLPGSNSQHQQRLASTSSDSVRSGDGEGGAARPPLLPSCSSHISGADGSRKRRVGHHQLAELKSSLSDRDLSVLHSVRELHLLTTKQLERLHCPAGEYTPLSAARTIRKLLRRLHDLELIDHLERRVGGIRAGSASYVWRLSPLGARLLDHPTRRRSQEPSLLHSNHVLAVAELVVRLHERARQNVQVELLEVQAEPDCWRVITAPHGGRVLLKPDLRVTLGVQDQELHWFVEQDNASEHRPVLTRKCETYLQAWRDGSEQATAGVFPRVLWVVPDQARVEVMRSVIEALPQAPGGMFVVAATEQAITVMRGAEP
jgi:hypothetical protein